MNKAQMKPTLILMCGLPCSGKTTLAKKLEHERAALRLTPDEWMDRIVGDGYNEEKRATVEAMMMELAERCLKLGINVILDFGFWSKDERDTLREKGEEWGAKVEIQYLNVSHNELMKRANERTENGPEHTFSFTEEQLKLWESWFEPPEEDELT